MRDFGRDEWTLDCPKKQNGYPKRTQVSDPCGNLVLNWWATDEVDISMTAGAEE